MSKLLDYNHSVVTQSDTLRGILEEINGDPSEGIVGSNEQETNRKFGKASKGEDALNRTFEMMRKPTQNTEDDIKEALHNSLMESAAEQKAENEQEDKEEAAIEGMRNDVGKLLHVMEKYVKDDDDYLLFGEEIIEDLEDDVVKRDGLEAALDKHKERAVRKIKGIQRVIANGDVVQVQQSKRQFIKWLSRMPL